MAKQKTEPAPPAAETSVQEPVPAGSGPELRLSHIETLDKRGASVNNIPPNLYAILPTGFTLVRLALLTPLTESELGAAGRAAADAAKAELAALEAAFLQETPRAPKLARVRAQVAETSAK